MPSLKLVIGKGFKNKFFNKRNCRPMLSLLALRLREQRLQITPDSKAFRPTEQVGKVHCVPLVLKNLQ